MNRARLTFLLFFLAANGLFSTALPQSSKPQVWGTAQRSNSSTEAFEHFITVSGSKLMDGEEEFRFISFNVPTLLYVEDEMAFHQANPYGLPTEYELRDLYRSINQLGGRVVRAYTIPVRNTNFPPEAVTYVEGPGQFNEEAFRTLDMAIALAAEHRIRLVIPLLNNWEWMGGRPNYAAFRGKTKDEFWTDSQLIEDFKLTVKHVLTRVNTVNGIPYKDDPTILAWETGNELQNPPEWAIEICRYMKSLDSNHLIIDGFHAIHDDRASIWVQQYSIDEQAIDIINTHHYEKTGSSTVRNIKKTLEIVGGKKPVFVGEFGFIGTPGIEEILDYMIQEENLPGGLIWSLRRHHKLGGFYHHTEPFGRGRYRAYHWPGFDDGNSYDERNLLSLMRRKAFEIQGKPIPKKQAPAAPELLPFESVPHFSWRGSAGASGYDIERASAAAGPWQTIAYNMDDINTPGFCLFSDELAKIGSSVYYRVRARNEVGLSDPSNVIHIPKVEYLTRLDQASHLMVVHRSKEIEVLTGDQRSYKEASSRLHGKLGSQLIYRSPGKLREIRVYAFEEDRKPSLSFSSSSRSETYRSAKTNIEAYASQEKNYNYLVPIKYTYTPESTDVRRIKIDFSSTSDIVRVEMDYQR